MKFTNNYNLPDDIIDAIEYREEDGIIEDAYRVTTLIQPVQKTELVKRFGGSLDYSQMLDILDGNAYHDYMQKVNISKNRIAEKRIVKTLNGVKITGKIDVIRKNEDDSLIIVDYKKANVWKFVYRNFDDWTKQLNIYNWLLDFKASKLLIRATLKNWDKNKKDADYPNLPFQEISLPIWSPDETIGYIQHRVELLKSFEAKTDEDLLTNVYCTDEEQYKQPEKFAVIKKGNKKALVLCNTIEEAFDKVEHLGNGYTVEIRPSVSKCLDYCSASAVCPLRKQQAGVMEISND
ncbi:MAG: PD-(D/E)XK nuclease family protein [Sulfolobaceae archaeon]